jgi:hypothetical protein
MDNEKNIKRQNFDPVYYRTKYFMHNIKTDEDARKHYEKIGYHKEYIISICDEMKTHDCLCNCKIKNNFHKTGDRYVDILNNSRIIRKEIVSNYSTDVLSNNDKKYLEKKLNNDKKSLDRKSLDKKLKDNNLDKFIDPNKVSDVYSFDNPRNDSGVTTAYTNVNEDNTRRKTKFKLNELNKKIDNLDQKITQLTQLLYILIENKKL